MNRRHYLSAAGSLAVIPSLAGCLGGFLGSDSGETLPADHRENERSVNRAVGNLNKAAISIEHAQSGLENPEEIDFSTAEPRSFIEDARTALEDTDEPDTVDELRSYSGALEGMVDVLETITDETLEEDIETVSGGLSDEDTEGANETLETRDEETGEARTSHDEAVATLESLDRDRLEDHSIVEIDRVESGAESLGAVLGSFEALISGYDSTLSGHDKLERGEELMDEGEYENAAVAFENAANAFGDATEAFEDGDSDAPSGLEEYFDTARCQSGHLETATDHFAEAAKAADSGDVLGTRQHRSDGEDALEAADAC